MAIEAQLDWSAALWHCTTTATTVGYGDVKIESSPGRWWAVVHILLSVSMLGDAIHNFDVLRAERNAALKRVHALNQPLTQPLLETIELRAVGGMDGTRWPLMAPDDP